MAVSFYCRQFVIFDMKALEKNSWTGRVQPGAAPSRPDELHINFNFSCKPLYFNWLFRRNSAASPLFRRRLLSPSIEELIRLNLQEFMRTEHARETMGKKLENWPMLAGARQTLIDFALDKARDVVEYSISHLHNTVHLHFHVTVTHLHTFYPRRTTGVVEDHRAGRVPALESAIEALERKTLMDNATCAICLEDFSYGCEVTSMPCSHVFHGDCIKQWLRIRHYCPMCRYQMPIQRARP